MNIITIMSDEHSGSAMGHMGDPYAVTPNLDRLQSMGAGFTNAYTPCPLCVPARASWFTGQYVNRLGTWDNSTPYDGNVLGISQYLKRNHIPLYHFGKTHFHKEGDYEFADIRLPGYLNTPDLGCYYREEKVERIGAEQRFLKIGIRDGENHDDQVTEMVLNWLDGRTKQEGPWALDVGYLDPHFPFSVRAENWNYFDERITEIPEGTRQPYTSLNEPLAHLRDYFKGDAAGPETIRRVMVGYYAALKELDDHIGQILDVLTRKGLLDETVIIYTSDHGEQMGFHGLWWKCCMFEQSARIPLLIAHPRMEKRTIEMPVSLTDLFPTMCELLDLPIPERLDGKSLVRLMREGQDHTGRDFAFSEYHAHGMPCAMYMVRWSHYKYVYYTDWPPQLFDLLNDPGENDDLSEKAGKDQELSRVMASCHERLLSVCDPQKTDERAKAYQKRMKQALGITSGYDLERGAWVPHPEHVS